MGQSDDTPPPVKDHPGKWDEFLAGAIVALPFVLAFAAAGYLLVTGRLGGSVRVSGTVPADVLAYILAGVFVVTYALALVKLFGPRAVGWMLRKGRNFARDYQPPEDR